MYCLVLGPAGPGQGTPAAFIGANNPTGNRGIGLGGLSLWLALDASAVAGAFWAAKINFNDRKTRFTSRGIGVNSKYQSDNRMRKIIFPLVAVMAAMFAAGCAGPESKLGRGVSNTFEAVRLG